MSGTHGLPLNSAPPSLAAGAPKSVLLRQRARNEQREIDSVTSRHASRYAVVPLYAVEPIGFERLLALAAPAQQN